MTRRVTIRKPATLVLAATTVRMVHAESEVQDTLEHLYRAKVEAVNNTNACRRRHLPSVVTVECEVQTSKTRNHTGIKA